MCSPSRGAGRSAAIGLPSITIGVRTPGMLPALAAALGRLDPHAAMNHLRVGKDLVERVDRTGRHLHGLELRQQVGARQALGQRGEARDQLVAVVEAVGVGEIARLLRELRLAEHRAQLGELVVVAGGDDDVAVGDREHLVGHDVGMRVADALGHLAGDQDS